MGYVAIANKLVELIDEVTEVEQVYNHEPSEIETYPAATVQAIGHRDRFNDTASNIRSFTFLIRLYYRADVDQDAETILRTVADAVIAKLEANVTVAGVWDIARPTESTWRWGEREVPQRIVELTVSIEQRVNR
jgi:hypothetical protein